MFGELVPARADEVLFMRNTVNGFYSCFNLCRFMFIKFFKYNG